MRTFFLIFLLVPLAEIYFLIAIGSVVGAGLTVLLVVFTAVLGAWLVRAQGFATLSRVQRQLAQGQLPALELFEGLVLFVAGALLLTPGFFTDAIGFLCLVPPLRRKIIRYVIRRQDGIRARMFGVISGHAGYAGPSVQGRVIDVDHETVER